MSIADTDTDTDTDTPAPAAGDYRLVGVEEHCVTEPLLNLWRGDDGSREDPAIQAALDSEACRRLLDTGDARLRDMDRTGLDVQVLSLTTPGLQALPAADAATVQRGVNDAIATAVRARPTRLQGLAALATTGPQAAADELSRAITELGLVGAILFGRTGEANLDDQRFWPIFEAAQALGAPLHLHPQTPPGAVRECYYNGLPEPVAAGFATFGVGWHYDAGVQFLRLVLGGVLDRFPDLQLVIGHWGELVLFYLERLAPLAALAGLHRSLPEYVTQNLHVAPGGIFSQRYLRWATEIVGVDRILFSTDYPFAPGSLSGARAFLDASALPPEDRARVASGNWERLCAGIHSDFRRINPEG